MCHTTPAWSMSLLSAISASHANAHLVHERNRHNGRFDVSIGHFKRAHGGLATSFGPLAARRTLDRHCALYLARDPKLAKDSSACIEEGRY